MPKIPKNAPWVILIFVGVVLQSLTVLSEAKLPSTDVFLFKEAGVNLAMHGRFAAKNLPNMPADRELVFSYYPPVYPFCFGVWTKLVGLGLKQSLAFDALLRVLRSLLIGLFFLPWIRTDKRKLWFAALSLMAISFLSSDGDRPDELALVWGWAAWLVAQEASGIGTIALSGVLLGVCAATSPAAGVFFVLGACGIYLANKVKPLGKPLFALAAAGLTFALCNLPIYLSDPQAYARFSKQVPLSTFPYLVALKEGKGFWGTVHQFFVEMQHPLIVAGPYLFLVLTLGGFLCLYFLRRREEVSRVLLAIFGSSFLYLFLCVFVWTLQPNYVWFSGVCFLGILTAVALERQKWMRALSIAVVVLALSPLFAREFKSYSASFQRVESDLPDTVRNEVLPLVGQHAKFAVTSDQYFTFRGDREVDNVRYVCSRLHEYDYVYISRYNSSGISDPNPFRIPCDGNTGCFTVLKDLSHPHPYQLFGKDTPYVVKGSAGILYQNTECPHAVNALSMNRAAPSFTSQEN